MRKVAIIFVIAVFVPSLVLAWLAVRSLRDQQFILERQQSLLCQNATDTLVRQVQELLGNHQREFAGTVEQLLDNHAPDQAAPLFDERLRTNWPLAEVGFVVTLA